MAAPLFSRTFRRGDRVGLIDDPNARGFFLRYALDGVAVVVEWDDANRAGSIDRALLRHAPVAIVGSKPAQPKTTCPECGKPLSVDSEAEKFTPTTDGRAKRTVVRVAVCGFCDFIEEVPK